MRLLRIKNKKAQQKILGKWMFLECEMKNCINPATIIMRNGEAVLCTECFEKYKKLVN